MQLFIHGWCIASVGCCVQIETPHNNSKQKVVTLIKLSALQEIYYEEALLISAMTDNSTDNVINLISANRRITAADISLICIFQMETYYYTKSHIDIYSTNSTFLMIQNRLTTAATCKNVIPIKRKFQQCLLQVSPTNAS